MPEIEFSKEEKEVIVQKMQAYFQKELDQEIGGFDAEFLLDFFSTQIGPYYYNNGLYDAQAMLDKSLDDIKESIYTLEKSTSSKK